MFAKSNDFSLIALAVLANETASQINYIVQFLFVRARKDELGLHPEVIRDFHRKQISKKLVKTENISL